MRTPKTSKIRLVEVGEDDAKEMMFEVWRDRRPILHIGTDEQAARVRIRKIRKADEPVILESHDGTRRDITKDFLSKRSSRQRAGR